MRDTLADTRNAPLVGAIEGGGTKFNCAVGYSPARILDRISIPTTDAPETLAACIGFFREAAAIHGRPSALGVACFGPLELRRDSPDFGCMLATPKAGWSNARILAFLENGLDLPVTLDTDVGAAALAEWQLGVGKGCGSLAYVTVGTGIGGAVVPAIPAGQRLMHSEMGHMMVRRDTRDGEFPGVCPFHGDCLEGLASGPAIRARWDCDFVSLPMDHPGRQVIGGYLGQMATAIILSHSVERIAFGGGVMSDGTLLPVIRRSALRYLNGYVRSLRDPEQMETYLAPPELGDGAAIAGAIMLALDSLAATSSQ